MPNIIKIKNKPIEPKRKIIGKDISFEDYESPVKLYDFLHKSNSLDSMRMFMEEGTIRLCWEESESDEMYNKRLEQYKKDLQKYVEWFEQNKEDIEYTLHIREEKEKKTLQKRRLQLLLEIKKIEKKIK